MKYLVNNVRAFVKDEEGVALTEYLVLLGLLIGGVIVTVGLAGNSLDGAWNSWSTFWDTVPTPDGGGEGEGGDG